MADSIEQVVYDYLKADTTFSAQFTGIYWLESPTTITYPYIVLWLVDDNGAETKLHTSDSGEARIQFDLFDSSTDKGKNRCRRLRTVLRTKVKNLAETRGGYFVQTIGLNMITMQRESASSPHHYIVDAIIKWHKE